MLHKEGRRVAVREQQKSIVCGYAIMEERYTQRGTTKGTAGGVLSLENAQFQSTAVESHGVKAPLAGVQHFHFSFAWGKGTKSTFLTPLE